MILAPDVDAFLERKGIDHEQVEAVLEHPDQTLRRPSDTCYWGSGLIVIVEEDEVVFVARSQPTNVVKQRKAKGGGGGSRLPQTFRELDKLARGLGLQVTLLSGGHTAYYDGDSLVTVRPATASDHRAVANAAHQLIRAGYDVRRTG